MARKRGLSQVESGEAQSDTPRKKPVACRPCHSRKVKCPGGEPCTNCEQSRTVEACVYPARDHKVTVSQSYIDKLVAENQRLRDHGQNGQNGNQIIPVVANVETTVVASENNESLRNPLLEDRSWFFPLRSLEMPIHVGEAADAAFATRFRQALSETHNIEHIPRTNYAPDQLLNELSNTDCPWPPIARARLLVKFAMDTVGQCYHCVRKSHLYKSLEKHYGNLSNSNSLLVCKFWILFALGEAYSSRTESSSDISFPGLAYFTCASRVFRNLQERPRIDTVEVLLLLSLYSLLLNRRHSAYVLASSAVRTCIILGIHQNIPESQMPDRAAREHCVRLWWTTYCMDRLWASKMGHPASIQDDDIFVDLPSDTDLPESDASDFFDVGYAIASIQLAKLSAEVITSTYSRKTKQISFSQRVQRSLKELRTWVADLPKHLQIDSKDTARPLARSVKWLHLSFNQYVIVATRPILLHIVRTHKDFWKTRPDKSTHKQQVGETPLALSEACIRCARHSHRILTESWIDGSFATFDYNYIQYFFSAATILAVSGLSLNQNDKSDLDDFNSACLFIEQLKQNGNFGGKEFTHHLNAMKVSMAAFLSEIASKDTEHEAGPRDIVQSSPADTFAFNAQPPDFDVLTSNGFSGTMTTEMALAEPSLQDFLAQADLDLGILDTQMREHQAQTLYWPAFQDQNWMSG